MAVIGSACGVIILVAALLTDTEGEGCSNSQQAMDLMFDIDVAFDDTLKIKPSFLPVSSILTFHNFTKVQFNDDVSVELIDSDDKGLRISAYGLLESEITSISGLVSIWVDGDSETTEKAEELMSCGFSDVTYLNVVNTVTYENITIAQVTVISTQLHVIIN